jgi:hypothetical protein
MSSVRLRIVINSSNGIAVRNHARIWEELRTLARHAIASASQYARQAFCGLRGHDDRLLAQRNHLSLACGRCGRVTNGWELPRSPRAYASPSRHHRTQSGPRYFQLMRRS